MSAVFRLFSIPPPVLVRSTSSVEKDLSLREKIISCMHRCIEKQKKPSACVDHCMKIWRDPNSFRVEMSGEAPRDGVEVVGVKLTIEKVSLPAKASEVPTAAKSAPQSSSD